MGAGQSKAPGPKVALADTLSLDAFPTAAIQPLGFVGYLRSLEKREYSGEAKLDWLR